MLPGLIRRGSASRDWGELAFESTTFSLSTQVPRPTDRRAEKRIAPALPLVKLSAAASEDFCRVRNISAGGVMVETIGQVPRVDETVHIEFDSHRRVTGQVVWTRPPMVGIKFENAVDLRAMLSKPRPRRGIVPRPPRLEIRCGGTVRIDKLYYSVEVRDISQGGVKVDINDWQCVGKPVVFTVESLRPIKGVVRWYRGGQAGIVFDKPLSFEELAEWLGKRVEIASLKTGAWEKKG